MRTITRRLAFYVVTAIVAVSLDFLIPRLIPGNPVEAIISHMQGVSISKATIAALNLAVRHQHQGEPVGPVHPLLVDRAARQPRHLHQQRVRAGHQRHRQRAAVDARAWSGSPTVISFVLGTAIGTLVAWKRGSWLDSLLPVGHVLPGRAVLLPRLPRRRPVRHQARLVPGRGRAQDLDFAAAQLDVHQRRAGPRGAAGADDRRRLGGRLDRRDAQRDAHDDGRGLRPDRRGQGPGRSGGSSGTRPATRSCRACPGSRWRSASSSPAPCSPRSCSATRDWACCWSTPSATTTTRCCRASS